MRVGKMLFSILLIILFNGCYIFAATIPVTTTIQAAIDSASDGDLIVIPAGTYNEQFTIDGFSNLTITGAGPGV